MTKDGFSSPYCRAFYKGEEISAKLTRLRYVYDEEDDDEIELVFEVENPADADLPQFQEEAEIRLTWGYIGKPDEMVVRKVWVREPSWSFEKDNIRGTIRCTEKGSELKNESSKRIYKRKNLPQIVQDVADRNGLKAYVDIPEEKAAQVKIRPMEGETLNHYLVRENEAARVAKQKATWDEVRKHPEENKRVLSLVLSEWEKKNKAIKEADDIARKQGRIPPSTLLADGVPADYLKSRGYLGALGMFTHENVPQANRSTKQLLKSLGNQEGGGPYFVETRDDEIILKKRDFLKKPYKTYTYGSPVAELLDFTPETKKRVRKGSSTASGFGGWNPLSKTTFNGEANAADNSPGLSKAMELLANYRRVQKNGGGQLIAFEKYYQRNLFIDPESVKSKIDNTGVYTKRWVNAVGVTVDDAEKILSKAIDDFQARREDKKKELYNALGLNPIESYNQAANSRRTAELKKNKVSATVVGDPNLRTGMVITIAGVSKKYNGNYYVIKVSHDIQGNDAYLTTLEMVRQGHNIKVNENYKEAAELGRDVNRQSGDDSGEIPNKKVLGLKRNPTN